MMRFISCSFIGLFILFSFELCGKTIYISSKGNDENTGTIKLPYKTIRYGLRKAQPGDTVYVRGGIYHEIVWIENSGTMESPISILGYKGEKPIIDGGDRLPDSDWGSLVLIEGDNIRFEGFEIRNSNVTGKKLGGIGVALKGANNSAVSLNVHHCWENGIIVSGDSCIVEDCMIWENCLRNEDGLSEGWASGLSAARGGEKGITFNAVFRRNFVYNNWGEGISAYESNNITIEDNVVYDNWSGNIYVSDAQYTLVQRNLVYNSSNSHVNEIGHITLADEQANKPRSKNNSIVNNLIYNSNIDAFWWTLVPGSGLDSVVIAHNTLINGQLIIGALPADNIVNKSSRIVNNIFFNDLISPIEIKGDLGETIFDANCWNFEPPSEARSSNDIIGDPKLQLTGNTSSGKLTGEFFSIESSSPVIDKGVIISELETLDYFCNPRKEIPDIGAHEYYVDFGSILAYPNPSTGDYNLILGKKRSAQTQIQVFDLSGKMVHNEVNIPMGDLKINLTDFRSGIYIIKVIIEGDHISTRLLKL